MASGFSVALLSESLIRLVPDAHDARYCVAFSGGVDSTALLHALAMMRIEQSRLGLRAVHVNHHLHLPADEWVAHCREFAAGLFVPLEVLDVSVRPARGDSIEARARAVRYAALSRHLAPGEHLLTAHHREDQLETLLLQLMRGAGVAGLSAMPEHTVLGRGILLRPLLGVDRADLVAYCQSAKLPWVEDTSNDDLRFDRNYMRQRVLPVLRERWQGAAESITRSALHLAEAQALLDERAQEDLSLARDGANLRVASLRSLAPARARNLLRFWIHGANHPVPSSAVLDQALLQMLSARADAVPLVAWGSMQLRRYRDSLYLCRQPPDPPPQTLAWEWRKNDEIELPGGLGRLRLRLAGTRGEPSLRLPAAPLQIAWKHRGQKLRLSERGSRRTLRNLFQERGVVPWMRRCLPLLYAGESLAAVADLWIDVEFRASDREEGMVVEWLDHPEIF